MYFADGRRAVEELITRILSLFSLLAKVGSHRPCFGRYKWRWSEILHRSYWQTTGKRNSTYGHNLSLGLTTSQYYYNSANNRHIYFCVYQGDWTHLENLTNDSLITKPHSFFHSIIFIPAFPLGASGGGSCRRTRSASRSTPILDSFCWFHTKTGPSKVRDVATLPAPWATSGALYRGCSKQDVPRQTFLRHSWLMAESTWSGSFDWEKCFNIQARTKFQRERGWHFPQHLFNGGDNIFTRNILW